MKLALIFVYFIFNLTVFGQNTLPQNFEGDLLFTIVKRASEAKEYYSHDQTLPKDQFETTEQYKERTANAEKLKAEKNRYFREIFVTVLNYQHFNYDADEKKLNIQTAFNGSTALEFSVSLGETTTSEKYIGTTAFGIQKEVIKTASESYRLFFITTEENAPVMSVDFDMEVAKARELKPNLRTAIYFELEYPFMEGRLVTSKATINAPYESSNIYTKLFAKAKKVLFFNQKSGEVLAVKEMP